MTARCTQEDARPWWPVLHLHRHACHTHKGRTRPHTGQHPHNSRSIQSQSVTHMMPPSGTSITTSTAHSACRPGGLTLNTPHDDLLRSANTPCPLLAPKTTSNTGSTGCTRANTHTNTRRQPSLVSRALPVLILAHMHEGVLCAPCRHPKAVAAPSVTHTNSSSTCAPPPLKPTTHPPSH